jgi:hypothetical protein
MCSIGAADSISAASHRSGDQVDVESIEPRSDQAQLLRQVCEQLVTGSSGQLVYDLSIGRLCSVARAGRARPMGDGSTRSGLNRGAM